MMRAMEVGVAPSFKRTWCRCLCVVKNQGRLLSTEKTERMIPFVEYRKLRKRLKIRARLSGIPMAFVGTSLSSALNLHFNPQMLEFQNPEVELTPIL